jgi:hypothetical protein
VYLLSDSIIQYEVLPVVANSMPPHIEKQSAATHKYSGITFYLLLLPPTPPPLLTDDFSSGMEIYALA